VNLRPPERPLTDGVVLLRPPADHDVPAIVAACQDAEIARWTLVPSPYGEEDARSFLEATWTEGAFAVLDAVSAGLLGMVGLRATGWPLAEIGYWTRAARGREVASRAVSLLARWAFELGAVRVELVMDIENRASQRVAEKAGFTREGVLRQRLEVKGRRSDAVMFSLLPTDP
jgi:RimJ/RimL family protein N-acetyltransferase